MQNLSLYNFIREMFNNCLYLIFLKKLHKAIKNLIIAMNLYNIPLEILARINYNFIGIELEEKYYKIAEERINSAIKQTA